MKAPTVHLALGAFWIFASSTQHLAGAAPSGGASPALVAPGAAVGARGWGVGAQQQQEEQEKQGQDPKQQQQQPGRHRIHIKGDTESKEEGDTENEWVDGGDDESRCRPYVFIYVRGTMTSGNMGQEQFSGPRLARQLRTRLNNEDDDEDSGSKKKKRKDSKKNAHARVTVQGLNYAAILGKNMYWARCDAGDAAMLAGLLRDVAATCGARSTILLAAYSQGASVARRALAMLADGEGADDKEEEGGMEGARARDAETLEKRLAGIFFYGDPAGYQTPVRGVEPAARVLNACNENDMVCQPWGWPGSRWLTVDILSQVFQPHYRYEGWVSQGANHLIQRARMAKKDYGAG